MICVEGMRSSGVVFAATVLLIFAIAVIDVRAMPLEIEAIEVISSPYPDCKGFYPGKSILERHIAKSHRVDSVVYSKRRFSPCIVSGIWRDPLTGDEGRFYIRSSGVFWIVRDEGDEFYYNCPEWLDPFAAENKAGSVD